MSKQFFTYVHFVENTRPFYVGKGTAHRASIIRGVSRNKYYNNIVNKYKNVKKILIPTINEEEAYFLEVAIIDTLKYFGYQLANIGIGGTGGNFNPDRKPEIVKECVVCKEQYNTFHANLTKYCSEACRTFAKRRRQGKPIRGTRVEKRLRNTEDDKNRYGSKSLRHCIVCNKEFSANYAKYCSTACKAYVRSRKLGKK